MNGNQLSVLLFSIVSAAISIGAVIAVIRSSRFGLKPPWIISSLVGFVGLGVNWSAPDDLMFTFGFSVLVVRIVKLFGTGHLIVNASFPFVALLALLKAWPPRDD